MGTKTTQAITTNTIQPLGIADALFTKVQQRVLGVLFGNPGRSFYANELIALAESGTGAVQRELLRLERAGLLTSNRIGRQKHYQANATAPVYDELRGLILKTVGLIDELRVALLPLLDNITAAFVYGSVAKGHDTAASDIDLLVVSDTLGYAEIFGALEPVATRLGRPIKPTVYSRAALRKRLQRDNAFIKRIVGQPKLWLKGQSSDFAA